MNRTIVSSADTPASQFKSFAWRGASKLGRPKPIAYRGEEEEEEIEMRGVRGRRRRR
jgi:hypothetical protein